MKSFTNIRALIIDMDGVLWHGDKPLPGLLEFFQALRSKQIPFILVTNNARMTPDQYVQKLAKMGLAVDHNEILTSAMATALYLSENTTPSDNRIFVIGESGAREPLIERGFSLTETYNFKETATEALNTVADTVVCGLDHELTWEKLATATLHIRAGAKFIATNADTTLPTEYGLTIGNGGILAALQAATGVTPTVIGKPEPIMYQQAINLLGVDPSETVAIGDRLNTDILGAVRAEIRSILVLTGVSTEEDLGSIDYQPTWILPDIRAVTNILQK